MSPPGQQNTTDQTANFFWLIALVTGALVAIWLFKRPWLVFPVYYCRYYELSFFQYILGKWNLAAAMMHLPQVSLSELRAIKTYIAHSDPNQVDFNAFLTVNRVIGDWIRWFTVPILSGLGLLAYFSSANRKFTHVYTMKSLSQVGKENWPEILPVLSLDLIKEDIEKGPWAMAKTPLDFCKENNLISPITIDQRSVWKLDRGAAHRLLTIQVGPLWTGVFDLPIHMKALVIIFIARAERERDIARRFLSQISRSAGGGKLDFSGVEEQLKKFGNTRVLRWLQSRHAYVYTMMASLLEISRSDGVLATAEFLWVKPVDRRLWYVLNSVGRQTAVVEISGAHSHWLTEKKLGRALRTPMVDEAVNALEVSMLDTLCIVKGDTWHTISVD